MFKLKGVVPPMITPFDENGNLAVTNLEKLVGFLKDQVDGLYICGSYGSGPLMNVAERKTVAEVSVKVANGKIPIVAHVGTTNTRDTVELSRHAVEIGCDAVAAVGPYYFHHKEDALLAFYSAMLEAVPKGYPVYLYHNPQFSGYPIALNTIRTLQERGLHGVKDATFDILTFATYMRELASNGMDIVLGTESMWLSACSLGAEAFIPGLGNAFPEICLQMWEQGVKSDLKACRLTQFKVNQMREIMYLARSTQLAVYAMLEIRDIVYAFPRAPFVAASQEEKDKIKQALKDLKVL
jgi:dihydrodipicolinate synthase/N-acetylneuraminate lyase